MADDIRHKTCSACNELKPIESFGISALYVGGRRRQCTRCRGKRNKPRPAETRTPTPPADTRRYKLKGRYGITEQDYSRMLAEQGGKCAICATDDPKSRYGVMHIDHCHKSGKVRALLCNPCNTLLGKVERSPVGLEAFSAYVLRYESR